MSEITRGAIGMPFEMAMESELSRRQFHSIAQALLAEREQLKADNDALRGLYQMHRQTETREMRDLKAENERLRKECARLIEDNLALLENPEDAL